MKAPAPPSFPLSLAMRETKPTIDSGDRSSADERKAVGVITPRSQGRVKGRGAHSNDPSRYLSRRVDTASEEARDDGWGGAELAQQAPETQVLADRSRRLITRNASPDLSFDQSLNPYKGCEHGCVYCYARPTHAYLDLSPGLDFETRLFHKTGIETLLPDELAASVRQRGVSVLAMGTNTDPYQPIERTYEVTRRVLAVLLEHRHPVSIVTKSALIERDIDLLGELAEHQLVQVYLSVTTLDNGLKARLEPRTASGSARLRTLRRLTEVGVPCGVMAAPIIPAVNDHEIEAIVQAAAKHGARTLRHILLRLPNEVAPLFEAWLAEHFPDRADRVMSLVRQSRGGKRYDSAWGQRMRGSGAVAELIAQRVRIACKKAGLSDELPPLRTDAFRVGGPQLNLFELPSAPN